MVAGFPVAKRSPIRLRAVIFAAAILAAGLFAPSIAAPPAGHWYVVLVAGDRAEPVFDNGIAALSNRLAALGVSAPDIHRLSADGGYRDPALEPATANRILQRIASLQPRPGDRCLVFITSHGQRGRGKAVATPLK